MKTKVNFTTGAFEVEISDEDGAQMVMDLQKVANIDVPYDRALRIWKRFSHVDRSKTFKAHRMFVVAPRN